MKSFFVIILWSCFAISCREVPEKQGLKMDFGDSKVISIESLCDSIFYVPIAPDELIPGVDYVKTCGEYLFLFSFNTNRIFILDRHGKFVNVLKKRGRGPSEYLDIGTFAYDPIGRNLVIHTRHTKELIRYTVPELEFVDRWSSGGYYNSLTSLSNGTMLGIKEASQSSGGSIELLDLNTKATTILPIPTTPGSLEVSVDSTLSSSDEGDVYYAQPGQNTQIFKFDSRGDYQENYYLNFGKYGVPTHYWREPAGSVNFRDVLFKDGYTMMVQYFIDRKNTFAFWYIAPDEDHYNQLYIYNKENKTHSPVKKIRIPGYNGQVAPLGTMGNFYIASLSNQNFDMGPESGVDQKLRRLVESNTADQPILMFFRLKDNTI